MSDITVSVSNKTNFPSQAGIPALIDPFLSLDYTIESIYGNVGFVQFDLNFEASTGFTLNDVEVVSYPSFYSVSRLSPTSFRVVQTERVFQDRYDFALFNSDATVRSVVSEENIIQNLKKTIVEYQPPAVKTIMAYIVVRYSYTNNMTPLVIPVDANKNITLTQMIYWEYNIALNKFSDFVDQGDY